MNVINLLKNNFSRIINKKEIIIIAVIVIPIMIGVSILFSSKLEMKMHIAFVSERTQGFPESDKLQIDVLKEKPETSSLLLSKYSAIVEEKSDGTYEVTTIKSEKDKEKIEAYFNGNLISDNNENETLNRGVGTNIIGFLLMIVLMQGVALMLLFPEDRMLKTIKRVLTSPVSEKEYLFAQGIFTFLCLYIPTYLAIVITKVCFNVDVGFSLGMIALLIGILSALSTSFALFFTSVLEKEISLAASGVYVITSILAGSFYSFTDNNKILDAICSIIPQKGYMTMVEGIEKGSSILDYKVQLVYLLVCILGFWLVGSAVTKKRIKIG